MPRDPRECRDAPLPSQSPNAAQRGPCQNTAILAGAIRRDGPGGRPPARQDRAVVGSGRHRDPLDGVCYGSTGRVGGALLGGARPQRPPGRLLLRVGQADSCLPRLVLPRGAAQSRPPGPESPRWSAPLYPRHKQRGHRYSSRRPARCRPQSRAGPRRGPAHPAPQPPALAHHRPGPDMTCAGWLPTVPSANARLQVPTCRWTSARRP